MSNQIPGLQPSRPTPGAAYHWKPSPRLRAGGWTNLELGRDWKAACLAAMARNEEVAAWDAKRADPAGAGAPARRAPPRPRWRDLVAAYKASDAFRSIDGRPPRLKPKTQAEYRSRIAALTIWADDGDLALAALNRQLILDLRRELVRGSPYRAAALLRVLSLLLQFAEDEGMIGASPALRLKIPTPPRRRRRILREHLPWLLAAAEALDFLHVALGCVLGFYTVQREADLLGASAFQIRAIDDVSSDARRTLAAADGQISGLWLKQQKTGAWVAVALVPWARGPVEVQIAASRDRKAACTNLILCRHEDRPCPEWRFQRDFRAVVTLAARQAEERQDHALAKLLRGEEGQKNAAIQFRDLRRSGMCWLREMRVPKEMIATISGHSIKETEDILETYMPRDTRAAAEGMAIAVARQAERDAADAAEREGQG